MAAFDGMGTREVRPADCADLDKLAERVAALEKVLAPVFAPAGCICPPTSERTCMSQMCPRKPIVTTYLITTGALPHGQ